MKPLLDEGFALTDVRAWNRSLPLDSVWGQTEGSRTNPRPLWRGGVIRLSDSDGELIVKRARSANSE